MSRPLVALTTGVSDRSGRHSKPAVFIYNNYITALERCGLAPVLITPGHTQASIEAILDSCAGLVLSGGEDVDPARYGQAPSPVLGTVSAERDETEFFTLDAALTRDMPVFAICRGMQVLNIHLGGNLIQDLPSEAPSDVTHAQTGGWSEGAHDVTVDAASRLRRIAGVDRFYVNSSHHQAVNVVAPALVVTARAPDGTVEALESREHAWVLGVQWHPERPGTYADAAHPDFALFHAFHDVVCSTNASR